MTELITKRGLIRILTFALAILGVQFGFLLRAKMEAQDYRRQLENGYARALGELSAYLTNISDDLEKGRYIGTPAGLSSICARVWRETGGAKSALESLPAGAQQMDAVYKFLSQTGDYAMALSKKAAAGGEIDQQDQENAAALRSCAQQLQGYIDGLQQQVLERRITLTAGGSSPPTAAGGNFEGIDQTMVGYPTLIYDGPFSDHLLTRHPRFTRGMPLISAGEAQKIAAQAARTELVDTLRGDDENSNMPCYTFQAGDISVGVTKAGGRVAYLINGRSTGDERIRREVAFSRAQEFLQSLGYQEMRPTYFESVDGVFTINFAAVQEEVILYTDLIKVGVALDDGSIVFFDARGYLNHHEPRSIPAPAVSAAKAAEAVNPSLKIASSRLVMIPTAGENEVLCYEFAAAAQEGEEKQQVLSYINALTGGEEQILLLIETPYGTLTK